MYNIARLGILVAIAITIISKAIVWLMKKLKRK